MEANTELHTARGLAETRRLGSDLETAAAILNMILWVCGEGVEQLDLCSVGCTGVFHDGG